ncbi:unnamed protein product [Meganyctiphanes norvegica]|uniref:Uncharacterized protein n=1 Tax=Meganyctiphanes norvegica TaxID=48144 RepID=A0AAV2Q1H7_MEGNR
MLNSTMQIFVIVGLLGAVTFMGITNQHLRVERSKSNMDAERNVKAKETEIAKCKTERTALEGKFKEESHDKKKEVSHKLNFQNKNKKIEDLKKEIEDLKVKEAELKAAKEAQAKTEKPAAANAPTPTPGPAPAKEGAPK